MRLGKVLNAGLSPAPGYARMTMGPTLASSHSQCTSHLGGVDRRGGRVHGTGRCDHRQRGTPSAPVGLRRHGVDSPQRHRPLGGGIPHHRARHLTGDEVGGLPALLGCHVAGPHLDRNRCLVRGDADHHSPGAHRGRSEHVEPRNCGHWAAHCLIQSGARLCCSPS